MIIVRELLIQKGYKREFVIYEIQQGSGEKIPIKILNYGQLLMLKDQIEWTIDKKINGEVIK